MWTDYDYGKIMSINNDFNLHIRDFGSGGKEEKR